MPSIVYSDSFGSPEPLTDGDQGTILGYLFLSGSVIHPIVLYRKAFWERSLCRSTERGRLVLQSLQVLGASLGKLSWPPNICTRAASAYAVTIAICALELPSRTSLALSQLLRNGIWEVKSVCDEIRIV